MRAGIDILLWSMVSYIIGYYFGRLALGWE